MERWMPKNGETYFYFNPNFFSDVSWKRWGMQPHIDHDLYQNGNCFKTREEALAAAEKVKSLLLSLHYNGTSTVNDETLKNKPLPKLTAEVFDRPDCPEWAKYAAVDKNGEAYFYETKPEWEQPSRMREHQIKWFTGNVNEMKHIPGKFDAANWQNSLVERPTKDAFNKLLKNYAEQQADKILQKAKERSLSEQYHNGPEKENTLPDWCEVGEWVWADGKGGYGKVYEIKDYIRVKMENGRSVNQISEYKINELSRAHLRPFNTGEMKALLGKVIEKGPSMHIVTGFENVFDNECMVHVNGCLYGANDLLRQFTIDNKPAGVLEHLENGEWVE